MRKLATLLLTATLLLLVVASGAVAGVALAADESPATGQITTEAWTPTYPGFTPYDQIKGILDETVATSDRVRYELMGHSAGGRELYLVIVARPDVLADLDGQLEFAQLMLDRPARAQEMLAADAGVKATIFVNCSIHGNEPNGVDAGLRMLHRLAYDSDAETQAILDNCIVLINICQNPDGRVADTRANANGFDLNRDFLTLSQPETQATTAQIARWLPTLFLDLHGYYNPMRIEPCTPPHNPNYEYDLFIKWALPEALAMRDAVKTYTRHSVNIPYLDMQQGFDDYSPLYTPQFAMYFGAIGHTLETFAENDAGTDGHFWASWAATLYAAQHKDAMLFDQIEQFRRGVVGYQQPDITFPAAYVIPAAQPAQRDPLQAVRMIDQLLLARAEVYRATTGFVAGGTWYDAGTYVVPLRQALRDLVNTWLWKGLDVSYMTNSMYSVCATSLPELLGFDRAIVAEPFSVPLVRLASAPWPEGGIAGEPDGQYVLRNDTNNAVRAVNELMDAGTTVSITTAPSDSLPTGTFVVSTNDSATVRNVATKYHLTFTPTAAAPADVKALHPVNVAVAGSADTRFGLKALGFEVTSIRASSALTGFDVVVNTSAALWASNVKAYVRSGGAYVGLGYNGAKGPLGNMLPVTVNVTNAYDNNALVRAKYRPAGMVGAYYSADDWAFVYRPLWFTSVGSSATVEARYRSDSDWFISGYWRDRAGAAGKPAVVSGTYGKGQVVYVGFAPLFRAYPEHTFRLVSNAIWYGME